MFCPSCTAENSDNASFCGKCGHHLRSAVGRPVDYVPPGSPPPTPASAHPATGYAGFWRRLAARIIDIIVVALVNIVITTIVGAVAGWEQSSNENRPEPLRARRKTPAKPRPGGRPAPIAPKTRPERA